MPKKECECIKHIDKAMKKGRAHWVCSECGKDVSMMYVLYMESVNKEQ